MSDERQPGRFQEILEDASVRVEANEFAHQYPREVLDLKRKMEADTREMPLKFLKCSVCPCENLATVFVVDHKTCFSIKKYYPGARIPCDDPKSVQGFCDEHWGIAEGKR